MTELTDALFEACGSLETTTLPTIGSRTAERLNCPLVRVARVLAKPTFKAFAAYVWDISVSGIALRCLEAVAPGTRLAINWQFADASRQRIVLARVVHASFGADQAWTIGCSFETPLSDDDIQSVFQPAQRRAAQ